MIILDLLKYFAKFPHKDGVLDIFYNGTSQYPQYLELKEYVTMLPEALVPEIQSLVFGSSLESVKARVNKISGTYLFVDFGEFSCNRDIRNSIEDSQRLAVTVAVKTSSSADITEEAIASDMSLELLNQVRGCMLADSEQRERWLEQLSSDHTIVPFEATDLSSIGWTLMFDISGSDWFNLKVVSRSFLK